MLKAIIFDLDGTLTDSDKFHFQVFKNFFALHGISLDRSLYRQKITGSQNIAILAEFLPHISTTAGKVFSAEKEESFRRLAKGQITPLPGLMTFLQKIQARGLPAAVVTNAPTENTAFMLGELGLSNRFHPVIIGDDLPRGKPDPLPYQTALNRLGLRPEEAIAFEDSRAGIRSAVGAGLKTIGMTTTHTSEELLEVGVARTIADFTDPFIQNLL
ncbi:MAG: HAD family phosphatase [Cyanobacteria bacterium P01_F01_bin.53]